MLTERDSGTVRRAAVGETVEIRLAGQPGTGFSWLPAAGTGVTAVQSQQAGEPRPGGVQTQTFQFRASRPGQYRLAFSYVRPWEAGREPARSVGFTIDVR